MPKRPKSHQLEDRSRAKFELIKPASWVFRDKHKDYGIDGEVELFDEDGHATGMMFYVQLKATASGGKGRKLSLKLDALEYYQSLDAPVLIARYQADDDTFFVKWSSLVDPFHAKRKGRKSLTLSFSDADIWTKKTPEEIRTHLTRRRHVASRGAKLPVPLFLRFDIHDFGGIPIGVWRASLRAELRKWSEIIELRESQADALVFAHFQAKQIVISMGDIHGCVLDHPDKFYGADSAVKLSKALLAALAVIAVQVREIEAAGRIAKECDLESFIVDMPVLAEALVPALLAGSFFELGLSLAEAVTLKHDSITLEAALARATFSTKPEHQAPIEAMLKRRIRRETDEGNAQGAAVAHYGLATHYARRRECRKALRQYRLALKAHALYERQWYFFAELGGLLFESKRYRSAYRAYLHALTLEKVEPEAKALCADAAMFAGHYSKALDLFEEYFRDVSKPDDEWVLKAMLLGRAIATHGVHEQGRRTRRALALADVAAASDAHAAVRQLKDALACDLLCGLAWFNLGNASEATSDRTGSALAYGMCGVIQRGDIEAQVNATLAALFADPLPIHLYVLIRTAFAINKDEYLAALYARLSGIGEKSNEVLAHLSQVLEDALAGVIRPEAPPTLRILGEDGLMRPINERLKELSAKAEEPVSGRGKQRTNK